MFKVIDLNDTGKTRKLLTECANNNGVFVCKHPEKVEERCASYGLPYVKAIGYLDLKELITNGEEIKYNIYIDELSVFLEIVLPQLKGWSETVEGTI